MQKLQHKVEKNIGRLMVKLIYNNNFNNNEKCSSQVTREQSDVFKGLKIISFQ